jgi:hypothetical protein
MWPAWLDGNPDFQIVVHQFIGLGKRIVVPGKELFLIVVIGSPCEHGADVQPLARYLPDHIPRQHAFGGVLVMRATRGMHMVIAGIPAVLRRIDPTFQLKREFGGTVAVHRELLSVRTVFRSAGVSDVIVTRRQADTLTIGAIDLRLEKEIGREALRGIRIEPVQAVANDKRGHGRLAFLVAHAQLNGARRERVKEHQYVVAKADVLAALSHVETDLCGALPAIPAIDLKDSVIQCQAGEAAIHGRLVIDGDFGPAVGGILRGQLQFGFGIAGGLNVDVAAIGAGHAQGRGHVGAVDYLHQKQPRAALHQLGLGRPRLDFHAAFGVDIDDRESIPVENLFQFRDGRGLVGIGDGRVDRRVVRRWKRLAQVIHGIFQAADLLGQRLERNGSLAGMLMRGSLRGGAAGRCEKNECSSGWHGASSGCTEISLHQNRGRRADA